LCGEEILTSHLNCPHCKGRIYTELVKQEGIEIQESTGKKWPFSEPPELKNDSSYILCEKGSTKEYIYCKKVHIMVCAVKCNRIFKCPTLEDALSEEGLKQFNVARNAVKGRKKQEKQAKVIPLAQRQRSFITLKKTDWRDVRKAIGEEKLLQYRKARKMNPSNMAKKLDLSLRSYQRLENGNAPRVRRDLLSKIEGKIVGQGK
jgi:DNA-binding XRE family transcriptional regulator